RPLAKPPEVADLLDITSPSPDDTFLALDDTAVIRPRVNRPEGTHAWFLNGRLVAPERAGRLELAPGRYELRCVAPDGQWSSVRFTVVSAATVQPFDKLTALSPSALSSGPKGNVEGR
ncbi:MAG TPA: hypothetical protein VMY39_06750, partial [Planctomycetota bacterium]|nr:hypothetical protein [Planctomycetota bacterium]